jgi:hypothetical protein
MTPLPNTSSWRGAQLVKHKDNFTPYHFTVVKCQERLILPNCEKMSGEIYVTDLSGSR